MGKIKYDSQLINNICENWKLVRDEIEKQKTDINLEVKHSLDKTVIELLNNLNTKMIENKSSDALYQYTDDVIILWKKIVEKSILCLRYFDEREPFKEFKGKVPVAYGIDGLNNYFDSFTEFESLLYGGSNYYRDHVIHAFRTWLLGLQVLLDNNGKYLKAINVGEDIKVNTLEKLSIWGIISLTHDLGYPLEKAQNIIDKTKNMMGFFISNPAISMNLSFSGVQNDMNHFILNLISSKMIKKVKKCYYHDKESSSITHENEEATEQRFEKEFVARRQPKYYFKLSKSLDESKHGILSSIIIYKLLQYFLESDFSEDEDYFFDHEGARQFYIRREILRAIASHTCHDIYHLDMLSFSYLLIIVDDAQDWGRKRFADLYYGSNLEYNETVINVDIDTDPEKMNKTDIWEEIVVNGEESQLIHAIRSQYKQSNDYKTIFKDGLDTKNRNFNLTKKTKINFNGDQGSLDFEVEFNILSDKNAQFKIELDAHKGKGTEKKYTTEWFYKALQIIKSPELEIILIEDKDKEKTWEIINK